MKESAAWVTIAKRVDRMKHGDGFLCDEVGLLAGCWGTRQIIGDTMHYGMKDRVRSYLTDAYSAFPEAQSVMDPHLGEFRKARVLAALWLALDAEAEERAARRVSGNPNRSTE